MSSNSDISGKKRARTDDMIFSASSSGMKRSTKVGQTNALQAIASFDVNKRATDLANKISSFYNQNPEMKYIIDSQQLQAGVEVAVKKYKQDIILHAKAEEAKQRIEEEKKRRAQALMYQEEETVPLHSLPDEVLQNCLSYVGKGHFGVVGLVSKKLRKSYVAGFGKKTKYLEMATSVKLVNYCLKVFCKTSEEKDELFKAAAVNGNLDILRHATSQGYDLFPLVEMSSETVYEHEDGTYGEYDAEWHGPYCEYRLEEISKEVFCTDEDMENSWGVRKKVKLSQIVARGHIHILKYLYEELNYSVGLQRYCRPAIQYGNVEILEWLDSIGCMNTSDAMHKYYLDTSGRRSLGDYRPLNFCSFAVKCGSVEALEWLLDNDFEFEVDAHVMKDAICSKSVGMIRLCFDLGHNFEALEIEKVIRGTNNLDVYRTVHELGFDFKTMSNWYDESRPRDAFEIIKFFRSVSIPWEKQVMRDFVTYGTIEMIRYAHENGCPWSSSGLLAAILRSETFSYEKFNYLMLEIGCQMDYNGYVIDRLRDMEDLEVLEVFVGKNSSLDNALLKKMVECIGLSHYFKPWLEGVTFILEKGKEIQNFHSIEEVFKIFPRIDGLKYFHSLGLPWCLDTSRNNRLLVGIACYNELDDVRWAYENGCTGGGPCVKDKHIESKFRHASNLKPSRPFLEENGILVPMNEFAQLEKKYPSRDSMFFEMNVSALKALVDRGFAFRSQLEKDSTIKKTLEECMYYSTANSEKRKRLALFQQMGVREL
ncbi:hypothetical protein CTEN210_12005 [Chaetoceros tenuissimus]|uniref:F-box domain-containing protein n=1 Tax=Chaetoceros tenuissimus TaxID=426638 RepID=A0AAD3D3Q7_9STRA|nr:hypothetical protein CTEN210_12005 [Chaetoceros tenuissimus]